MGAWSEEEDRLLIQEHARRGNRWAEIARYIPNRSENAIKNHWYYAIKKLKSTRRFKTPEERLSGIVQSTLLEEYIKKRFSDNGSVSSPFGSSSTTTTAPNFVSAPVTHNSSLMGINVYGYNSGINSLDDDDDSSSIPNFTTEAHDEEMRFMRNIFPSNENISS